MLLNAMLKWQWVAVALFAAGIISIASPGWAGLLVSSSGDIAGTELSLLDLEKEIIAATMVKLGWSREETDTKIARLSPEEIHHLSATLNQVLAGGEEEDGPNPLGVGIVIALILAGITGLYLFSQ